MAFACGLPFSSGHSYDAYHLHLTDISERGSVMPNLSRRPYSGVIQALPVLQHHVDVDAAIWRPVFQSLGQSALFRSIFAGSAHVSLSRHRLLNHAYANLSQKCAEILLWGYPTNRRGTGTKALRQLAACTIAAQSPSPWPQYCTGFPKGYGMTTITKIAYFFGRKFNGLPALILDQRVRSVLPRWREVSRPVIPSGPNGAINNYLNYLKNMVSVATNIGCRPDAVEFFLFSLGSSFG